MESRGIALVTGATGFIGSAVVRRLLKVGFEVRAVSSGTSHDRLAGVDDRVAWFGLTAPDLAVAAAGATHFFNFAVVYDRATFSDELLDEINVGLPMRLIDALACNEHAVTCVMGDSFYRKFSPGATAQRRYTESKNRLAQRISSLPSDHPCRVAMLLIEQVYGPGENLEKVFPRIVRQLLAQVARVPLTGGTQRRDFIYIADVVEAVLTAGLAHWSGSVEVGCGSGVSAPVKKVFRDLRRLCGSHTELGLGDIPDDQFIPESIADTSWLRARHWKCTVPLEIGLADFVADVKKRDEMASQIQ